ncbi:MAG: SDR family oxidoreductase [Mesorhizobium sp.]|nr:MAG: SDR family oxidoreductase [Mesorhizobium sp.]
MNFVYFSPHFPANGADFCDRLKKAGATVLGIGDAPYEALSGKLKAALSEYYRVADMEDYEPVFRAMGHFIHKWGRIDRFESLNEHWLELEANIRTDFNVFGTKLDFVKNLKRKSRMRAFFRKSGVETIPQRKCSDRAGAMTFIRVMEVVNRDRHMSYTCFPEISPAVEEAGRKILKAFDVRERFFHIELFETKDKRVIALEVNMRPPGAWMTDAINYTFDIDVYAAWADMVVKDAAGGPYEGKYFTAYASRKRHLHYLHSHADVLAAHGDKIVHHQAIEEVFSRAMGNYAYQMRSRDQKALRQAVDYIHAEKA